MKFKIKALYTEKGLLRVELEHEFGKENYGFSLKSKEIDPDTNEPKWMAEVKKLLECKSSDRSDIGEGFVGVEFDTKVIKKPIEKKKTMKYCKDTKTCEIVETTR